MTSEKLKVTLKLHKAWLSGSLSGKRADLSNADLSCTNLAGADLRDADLSDTNLCRANLRCADLSCANLASAILRHADLRGANLAGADLSNAGLRNADLRGANLRCAILRDADLREADIRNAVIGYNAFFGGIAGQPVFQTACGFGSRNAALTLFAHGKREEWRFYTGCFQGSERELLAAIAEKHEGKEAEKYRLAVEYLVNIATLNSEEQSHD